MLDSKNKLYRKIAELEVEIKMLKSEKKLLQYQLDRVTHKMWEKDSIIKEMKDGRSRDKK